MGPHNRSNQGPTGIAKPEGATAHGPCHSAREVPRRSFEPSHHETELPSNARCQGSTRPQRLAGPDLMQTSANPSDPQLEGREVGFRIRPLPRDVWYGARTDELSRDRRPQRAVRSEQLVERDALAELRERENVALGLPLFVIMLPLVALE